MKCNVCGAEHEEGLNFCPKCGATIHASAEEPSAVQLAREGASNPKATSDLRSDLFRKARAKKVAPRKEENGDPDTLHSPGLVARRRRGRWRTAFSTIVTVQLILMLALSGVMFVMLRSHVQLMEQAGELGRKIADAKQQLADDERGLREAKRELAQVSEDVVEGKREAEAIDKKVFVGRNKIVEINGVIAARERRAEELRIEIAREESALVELRGQVASAERDLRKVEAQVASRKREFARLKTQTAAAKRESRKLYTEVAVIKRRIEILNAEAARKSGRVRNLKQELAGIKTAGGRSPQRQSNRRS